VKSVSNRPSLLWRLLNFFVIGLLVGLALFYQYHRNQQLERDIRVLKTATFGIQAAKDDFVRATASLESQDTYPPDPKSTERSGKEIELFNSRQNAITRAIAKSSDAVVGINVVQVREVRNPWVPSDPLGWMLFDDRLWPRTFKQKVQNLGSGFIITSDGYIVTNEHVVSDAAQVVVTTTAGHKYDAKVVGTDPLLDMALLKIDAKDLPNIPLGLSEDAIVGEWVIAIGNPYGLFDVNDQPSVSVGVVSAVHRDFRGDIDGRLYTDMIQTDAAINRGNSGGPLLNSDGEAIGMCTLIFSESGGSVGIGFAIPSDRISAAINDLLKGGVNRNFWIGIRGGDINPTYARLQGMDNNRGMVVTGVDVGSPAAKAGVHIEDIILAINDRPVESAKMAGEILRSTDLRVGDKLTMTILRKRKTLEVTMTLAPLPGERG
jgi:serine protease Do